jgi:hypothetical protein
MIVLSEASLREVAEELRGRARRTCRGCGGRGGYWPERHGATAAVAQYFCTRCGGTGFEAWTELLEIAERLEAMG